MPKVKLTFEADFEQAKAAFKAIGQSAEEIKKLKAQAKNISTKSLSEFITKSKRMAASISATKGPMQAMITQQRMLGRQIERAIQNGYDPLGKELKEIREEYAKVTAQVKKNSDAQALATTKMKATNKAAANQSRILKQLKDSAVSYAKIGLVALTVATAGFTYSIVEAAARIEDAEAAFRPMLGSLAKARTLVAMINETAATTPFQFEDIATSAKQLLPAVRGSMTGVIKTFRMLGDVSSGNAKRLDTVTRAFTKSMLRGQVDMRAMNMMARAGIPIFSELADSMGITVAKLMKLSRTGEISSKDLVEAFQKMTSEGGLFFRGMEIASKTLTGRISTLKDNILILGANLGKVLLPYAKAFVETSLSIVQALKIMAEDVDMAQVMLESLAATLATATIALVAFLVAAKGAWVLDALAIAVKGVWAAFTAHPIGAIITALLLLVPTIIFVARNWEYLSKRFKIEAEFMEDTIKSVGAVISSSLASSFIDAAIGAQRMTADIMRWLTDMAIKAEELQIDYSISPFTIYRHKQNIKQLKDELHGYVNFVDASISGLEDKKKKINGETVAGTSAAVNSILASYKVRAEALAKISKPKKEAADTGTGTGLDIAPKLYEILNKNINDVEAKAQYERLNFFKTFIAERMKVYEVAAGKEIAFIRKTQKELLAIDELAESEKVAATKAANTLILEIQKKAASKIAKVKVESYEKDLKARDRIFKRLKKTVEKEEADAQRARDKAWAHRIAQNKKAWSSLAETVLEGEAKQTWGMERLGTFVSAFSKLITNAAETGKLAFKDMIKSILADLLAFETRKNMVRMFTGLFGGQPSKKPHGVDFTNMLQGSMLGPQFPIPKFAMGGIVSAPTVAMIGEAGPESVLPLVRRNGKLGVGSSSQNVVVNVHNNGQSNVDVQERTGADGTRQIDIIVEGAMNRNAQRGGTDQMMSLYGASRKGIRR